MYKLLAGYDDKSAFALCTFAYYDPDKKEAVIFEGKCHVSNTFQLSLFSFGANITELIIIFKSILQILLRILEICGTFVVKGLST